MHPRKDQTAYDCNKFDMKIINKKKRRGERMRVKAYLGSGGANKRRREATVEALPSLILHDLLFWFGLVYFRKGLQVLVIANAIVKVSRSIDQSI